MSKGSENSLVERFSEAWVNRAHRVLGRRLDPYCLHHLALLEATGNPLVDSNPGDRAVSWAHLVQAVIICSTPYEGSVAAPRRPLLWCLLIWVLRAKLAAECAKFRAYQNDFLAEPDIYSEDEGRKLTAPGILAKAVFLQLHCHIDDRRVWTMPIGKALWTYAAAAEQISDEVSLLKDEESALMEYIRRMQRGELPPDTLPPGEPVKERLSPEIFGK